MLLEDREDQIIIQDMNGHIDTKPKTDYFMLKFGEFDGDRIFYQFNADSWIQETYNEGIFNLIYKNERMQLTDSNKICFCINFHKSNKNSVHALEPFEELFKKNYADKLETDVLKSILKPFEHRLNFIEHGVEVDNRFYVDKLGQAHSKKNGVWTSLCIVAFGVGSNDSFDIDSVIGNVEINSKSLEIIAKVMFLLKPDTKDSVFTSQLSKELQEELRRDGF